MRRLIASVLLVAVLVVASVVPVHAGTSTDIALGLASFAVFNQVVGAFARPHPVIQNGWNGAGFSSEWPDRFARAVGPS